MYKTIFTSLFLFITLFGWSQDFAPEGAIWHYSFYDINPEVTSYATIESKYDTIIDDKSCMKMLEVHRNFSDTTHAEWHYMYSENDSVFFYADGDFHLLYDFGAEQGDTIVLDYYLTHDESPLELVVDSVGLLNFNGISKKVQYVTCLETIVIDFGPMIIEDIGRTRSMFPDYDGQITSMKWRCYEDYQNGLLLNPYDIGSWDGQNCEQIITSVEEITTDPDIIIAPNPVRQVLTIDCPNGKITEYLLTNKNGQQIKSENPSQSQFIIDFQSYPSGIYFLKLLTDDGYRTKKVIKL